LFLLYYSDSKIKFAFNDLNLIEKIFLFYISMIQVTMFITNIHGVLFQLKLIFLGSLQKYRLKFKSPEDYSIICRRFDNTNKDVKFIFNFFILF
jgi:hypothetical protein